MKTNVTRKLDAELLREARTTAAEQGSSIRALLAAQLEKVVKERKDYEKAKRKALALVRKGSIGATSLERHAMNSMSDKCLMISLQFSSMIPMVNAK